ncbi:hypothetical protein ElyMa_004491600 [Elysia marginata]|uniref:Uncharacterized protein n=1 Tax=Elysia marginata TaxID=1093978 RepID=A0AAV4HIT5_9GAST|nr:hypothetical protein ElyMa_004491600 [Elysia marginata]
MSEFTPLTLGLGKKQKRSDNFGSPSLKKVCFLCERERTTYSKKRDRNLILVSTIDRQRSIHEKAKQLQDVSVLTKVQGFGSECIDMVANDFRYHRSFMADFLNRKAQTPCLSSAASSATMSREESVLESIFKEVGEVVTANRETLLMSNLYQKYQECLQETTDGEVTPITIKAFKSKIAGHFGSNIEILSQNGKSDMVTSSRVSLQELWLQNEQMKVDVDDSLVHLEFSGAGDNDYVQSVPSAIFSVSKHIRALIKQQAKE